MLDRPVTALVTLNECSDCHKLVETVYRDIRGGKWRCFDCDAKSKLVVVPDGEGAAVVAKGPVETIPAPEQPKPAVTKVKPALPTHPIEFAFRVMLIRIRARLARPVPVKYYAPPIHLLIKRDELRRAQFRANLDAIPDNEFPAPAFVAETQRDQYGHRIISHASDTDWWINDEPPTAAAAPALLPPLVPPPAPAPAPEPTPDVIIIDKAKIAIEHSNVGDVSTDDVRHYAMLHGVSMSRARMDLANKGKTLNPRQSRLLNRDIGESGDLNRFETVDERIERGIERMNQQAKEAFFRGVENAARNLNRNTNTSPVQPSLTARLAANNPIPDEC